MNRKYSFIFLLASASLQAAEPALPMEVPAEAGLVQFTQDSYEWQETFSNEGPYETAFYPECCEDSCSSLGIFFSAEYLFWQAKPEALLFAIDGIDVVAAQQGSTSINPGKWNSGMRFAAEKTFCPETSSAWDLAVCYTWYKTHSVKTTFSDGLPLFLTDLDGGGEAQSEISNSWRLTYQVADITANKWFCPSYFCAWRPYVGVRGAWITNGYHTQSRYISGTLFATNVVKKCRSEECGLIAGFDTKWAFSPCWSLCTNSGLGILWSYNHLRYSFSDNGSVSNPHDCMTGAFKTLQMVYDLQVGIEYGMPCDLYLFGMSYCGMKCSWDFHYWPQQAHMIKLGAETADVANAFMHPYSLCLQGISLTFFLNW